MRKYNYGTKKKLLMAVTLISTLFTLSTISHSQIDFKDMIYDVYAKDGDKTSIVTVDYRDQTRVFKFVTKNGEEVIKRGGKYWKASEIYAEELAYDSAENRWYKYKKINGDYQKVYYDNITVFEENEVVIKPNTTNTMGIINVSDGLISDDSKEVINGSQLKSAKSDIINILGGSLDENGDVIAPTYIVAGEKYSNVADAIKAIDAKLGGGSSSLTDAGIAAALATANIAQVINLDRPYAIGAGTGFYNGESAIAVGMSGVNKDGSVIFKFNGTINTQGKLGAGAGLTYTFGTNNVIKEKEDISTEVLDLLNKLGILTKSDVEKIVKNELENIKPNTDISSELDKYKDELKETVKNEIEKIKGEKETKEIHIDGKMPFTCDLEIGRCVIYGFEIDSPTVNSPEEKAIKEIVEVLNATIEKASITVVGHTDYAASEEYNQILGRQRAISVMKLLKKYGLKESIYFRNVESASEYLPLENSNDKYSRYINRRVELYLDGLLLQKKDIEK